jgi:hypothetical protein
MSFQTYLILLVQSHRGCQCVVMRSIDLDSDVQNMAEVLCHVCLCFLGSKMMALEI